MGMASLKCQGQQELQMTAGEVMATQTSLCIGLGGCAGGGAEAVALGCTEIGTLVDQRDTNVRLFDSIAIHAEKAVEYATESIA